MSRGSRQQQHQHHNQQHSHQQSGSASTATSQNSAQHARRANRTLGWYLGGVMPEENSRESAISEQATKENTSQDMVNADEQKRKGSIPDTPSGTGVSIDARTSPRMHHGSRYRQQIAATNAGGRSRASSSMSAVNKKSDTTVTNQQHHFGKEQQNHHQQPIELHKVVGNRATSGKENYWYYDPVSDGYYYEHNGTRGWRKKNAKLDAAIQAAQMKEMDNAQSKMVEQQKKLAATSIESKGANIGAVPSLLSAQQLGKMVPPNPTNALFGAPTPMAIKYFDNDGYFYEMASVDGWRRRQPATTGNTPPNSLSSSLGGTQTKAPSPVLGGAKPRRKPLQYQAYQQPPPQVKTLGLQEMMHLAKQQQHNHQKQSTCCCTSASQTTTNLAPPCCCTIAAMAAQLILQKHQQIIGANGANVVKGNNNNNTISAEEIPKTKSTECMRSLLEGLSISKPPIATNEQQQQQHLFSSDSQTNIANNNALSTTPNLVTESQNQHQTFDNADNWQFSRSKWNGFGTAATTTIIPPEEKSTTLTVGSFEEPYEFYWSGDEANSEAPTIGNNKPSLATVVQQSDSGMVGTFGEGIVSASTTAASVSSIDDDGMEEMMFGVDSVLQQKRETATIAPIGSEAMRKMEEEKRQQQLKRPETLRLTCPKPVVANDYEPISPGEILKELVDNVEGSKGLGFVGKQQHKQFNNMPLQPHNFDVDKFIADLPPMPFNPERILHSLRNPLRTPMGPPTAEPLRTADSPLFTPIYQGKNPWGYRTHENPWAYP